ncbi:MAG TPA: STAS domain-containing protein [Actinomycetota bacterium]|nr:STAS domain-containing protein [Actinomycetota bacterium]
MDGPVAMETMVIAGPIEPGDIPKLCDRARSLLLPPRVSLRCDVSGIPKVDLVAVDALARLDLTAKRMGKLIRFVEISPALRDLLILVGLDDVLSDSVESVGQSEEREEVLGVEEETDP